MLPSLLSAPQVEVPPQPGCGSTHPDQKDVQQEAKVEEHVVPPLVTRCMGFRDGRKRPARTIAFQPLEGLMCKRSEIVPVTGR